MPGLRAVVLHCAGRSFVAGADIREFGKPPMEPHLPDVLAQIEGADVPWIAAIHGNALGGGLELALACRYRVAARGAKLGLPEVTLGLIPGAGGTVRLPRVIPATFALEMVAGASRSLPRALPNGGWSMPWQKVTCWKAPSISRQRWQSVPTPARFWSASVEP